MNDLSLPLFSSLPPFSSSLAPFGERTEGKEYEEIGGPPCLLPDSSFSPLSSFLPLSWEDVGVASGRMSSFFLPPLSSPSPFPLLFSRIAPPRKGGN